jgi:hypothetical protein
MMSWPLDISEVLALRNAYSLGIDLADIGQPLGKNIAGHLIPILVLELGCLPLRPLSERSGVRYGARHDTANRRRELEDVRHRRRVD